MVNDSGSWHFVFVFPAEIPDNATEWSAPMARAEEVWSRIFTGAEKGIKHRQIPRGITRRDFQAMVLKELVDLFEGPACGFRVGQFPSIDQDELFLTVALDDEEVMEAIGQEEEFPAMLSEEAYRAHICPTDDSRGGGIFRESRYGEHIDGTPHTNRYPGYVRFHLRFREILAPWNEAERIRLLRRRMRKFVKLHRLVEEGIAKQVFCAHHWHDLTKFRREKRWNDPFALLQWPSEEIPDCIQLYFGPDVAFFFHWFNAYTRWLLCPAILSMPIFLQEQVAARNQDNDRWWYDLAFAAVLALWSTAFVSRYKHYKNLKVLKWGMKDYDQGVAEVRREFRDDYRDTWPEALQKLLHWILCLVFMAETVLVTLWVSEWRMEAQMNPNGYTWGLRSYHIRNYYTYVITANIKLVDWLWTYLSTWLSQRENWRTRGELLNKMAEKLFAVKFVVFYYPFLFTILIRPHITEADISTCYEALSSDLRLFFITQICSEVCMLFVNVGSCWFKVWRETRKVQRNAVSGRSYTYLEYQAKCPDYSDVDFMKDVQLQVMNYGFLVLFGVCLPYVCFICFCVNFLFKRMLAYKISYVHQRPSPFGSEGISAGEEMVWLLSWVGVVFNIYLVIFVSPLCSDFSFQTQILIFLAAEHSLLILKVVIDAALGEKSTAQRRIEEFQERVMIKILHEHSNRSWDHNFLQVKRFLSHKEEDKGHWLLNCDGRKSN